MMMTNEAKVDALRMALHLMGERPDMAKTYINSVIDSCLADPSESAMEVVEKVQLYEEYHDMGACFIGRNNTSKADAAALIEGLQRRVPKAMLLKLLREYWPMGDEGQYAEVIRKYADEYGVVIE